MLSLIIAYSCLLIMVKVAAPVLEILVRLWKNGLSKFRFSKTTCQAEYLQNTCTHVLFPFGANLLKVSFLVSGFACEA